MHNKIKFGIVLVLLLSSIVLSVTLPKAKYIGTNFVSQLQIPDSMEGWQGKDVSESLNATTGNAIYNFLHQALAYNYRDNSGNDLVFIILDAGDFHYPNVCLTSAGFQVRDLPRTELNASGRMIKALTVYSENSRKKENYITIYWIVIDKKMVPNWIEQKIKQLYFSLFNKDRVGLMVRLDIPVSENNVEQGLFLAKQFISDLSQNIPEEHADYLFGKI